jgi:hypothetical protein
MNHYVRAAETAYDKLMFREALKAGFYDLQAARDRYRDITAAGDGMNWVLVERFIQVFGKCLHRSFREDRACKGCNYEAFLLACAPGEQIFMEL